MKSALLLLLCLGGCRHAEPARETSALATAPLPPPVWPTEKPLHRGGLGGERQFVGVGEASGIRNPKLRRETADARARAEIAKALDDFRHALLRNYLDNFLPRLHGPQQG